jgi:hypothetical protein
MLMRPYNNLTSKGGEKGFNEVINCANGLYTRALSTTIITIYSSVSTGLPPTGGIILRSSSVTIHF